MCEIDDTAIQIKPDKPFIDEYLTLKYGQKSQYNYFWQWYIVDDAYKHMWGDDFINKYKGQICVRLSRAPYAKTGVSMDSVDIIFANDHRMKMLYQRGEIGKIDWLYDDSLSKEEKLEYATGKRTDVHEWADKFYK